MAFVNLDDLSVPSKLAVFKLCFGNILFLLLGVVATGIGLNYLQPSSIIQFISGYVRGASSDHIKVLIDDNASEIIISICVILVAAGVGVALVSCIGFCGAITRNPHCMIGYATFLLVLICAECVGLAFFGTFKTKLDLSLQHYMKNGVLSKSYSSLTGKVQSLGVTTMFDMIQVEYDCCGVTGGDDYGPSGTFRNWKKTLPFNSTSQNNVELYLPVFCCKFKPESKLGWQELMALEKEHVITFSDLTEELRPHLFHKDCLTMISEKRNHDLVTWRKRGCYRSFQLKVFNSLFKVLIGFTVAIVIFEVLCLWATCVLVCDIKSAQSRAEKKEERELMLMAERDTILQGLQLTGSMGAMAITRSAAGLGFGMP